GSPHGSGRSGAAGAGAVGVPVGPAPRATPRVLDRPAPEFRGPRLLLDLVSPLQLRSQGRTGSASPGGRPYPARCPSADAPGGVAGDGVGGGAGRGDRPAGSLPASAPQPGPQPARHGLARTRASVCLPPVSAVRN